MIGAVFATFCITRIPRVRISQPTAIGFLGAIFISTLVLALKFRVHPVVAAAWAAPLVHSVTWFLDDGLRNRGWRMGIGFVELILAASLTTEAYLFLTIFAYVILGSLAASLGFLSSELRVRAPARVNEPLPSGFVRNGLGLAFLIFLSSGLIFPFLPSAHLEGSSSSDDYRIGYTENVDLVENVRIGNESGQSVLWLYPRKELDPYTDIFLGLIRGKSLDIFDGKNWIGSAQRSALLPEKYVKPTEVAHAIQVDVVKSSSLTTKALPVPYGTIESHFGAPGEETSLRRTVGGAWVDGTDQDRTRYTFSFMPYLDRIEDRRDVDPPMHVNLQVPKSMQTDRMQRLAHALFAGASDTQAKVERLRQFFTREKFHASVGESEFPSLGGLRAAQRLEPIERFLFITKEGHCEWFATASAVLLRMAGVPTRLVAGFRVSENPVGGVLTVTNNDAHAWIEYWSPSHGWVSLDLTPRVLRSPDLLSFLRGGYDWASGYWYRYVFGYRDPAQRAGSKDDAVGGQVATALKDSIHPLIHDLLGWAHSVSGGMIVIFLIPFLGMLFFGFRVLGRRGGRWEGIPEIRRQRTRMEKLLFRFAKKTSVPESAVSCLEEWRRIYDRLRFGPASGNRAADIDTLARKYRELKALL